ncbi:cadherin EGF LAG seven-pass G-type receptor 2-like [Pimephales promelas]|uniref:cadherin EGF LAG seven-pass G-type receptor 2-like n=1 Tax=Pimephales promelas TaxID=90988 RepID=UPI00195563D2|nr:cadherin EGF LAG seven-pass G-type receptor 2-like [Pimephales promelas]
MERVALFSVLIIFACMHVHSVRCAIGSTEINCASGGSISVGRIDEGYEGDVEIITNIVPYDHLSLETYMTSNVLTMLELVQSEGDSTATVRTIRPLDAEEIRMSSQYLTYFVKCSRGPRNAREVVVIDVNEHAPIFQSKTYSATLSEATVVGSGVLKVTATDKDATTEHKMVGYSIQPPVPADFGVSYREGNIILTKPLNYNNVQQYIFTVEAKDAGGLSDTATVIITIEDFDNQTPYFGHCLYKASIEENQVGHFSDVTPAAIQAQDGDKGINEPVVYSIKTVIPNEFQNRFEIDRKSGVISVTTALEKEEIEQIAVFIQATQQDDASKTADAVVLVTIVDVTDNPTKFDQGVGSSLA